MKIIVKLLLISLLVSSKSFGQMYVTQVGETSFFSETPAENISALNKTVGAIINTTTNEIAVSMKMSAFEFPNKLMQEHFNENYMESEKYPMGTFKGKIENDEYVLLSDTTTWSAKNINAIRHDINRTAGRTVGTLHFTGCRRTVFQSIYCKYPFK